jgi:putative transposase
METAPLRKQYPSDLTDDQWMLIGPYIPKPQPGPNPWKYDRREIVNAIRYKLRTGCGWEYLPHDLPSWKSASDYFYLWRDDGTWDRLVTALRRRVRRAEGRADDPSLGIIDSQSVKSGSHVGASGFDGGKRVKGRKRHMIVDILGLLLAVCVTAASVSDQAMIRPVAARAQAASQRLQILIGDGHYQGPMADRAAAATGLAIEVRRRPEEQRRFTPIPIRWHVEQAFGWINHWRELAKEYTHDPRSTEAWIQVGFIGLMATRLQPATT